jgi:hypothetical protein
LETPVKYLDELSSSGEWDVANNLIHPDSEDEEYARTMWKSLSNQLQGADLLKYRELLKFGRGFSAVKCRDKK